MTMCDHPDLFSFPNNFELGRFKKQGKPLFSAPSNIICNVLKIKKTIDVNTCTQKKSTKTSQVKTGNRRMPCLLNHTIHQNPITHGDQYLFLICQKYYLYSKNTFKTLNLPIFFYYCNANNYTSY